MQCDLYSNDRNKYGITMFSAISMLSALTPGPNK